MYPEERKTPAGAGDGRDMVAPNPERSCLICVRKQKWKPKSVRERWDIFELTEIENVWKAFSEAADKQIREAW